MCLQGVCMVFFGCKNCTKEESYFWIAAVPRHGRLLYQHSHEEATGVLVMRQYPHTANTHIHGHTHLKCVYVYIQHYTGISDIINQSVQYLRRICCNF